jgi:hypothetical protein
MLRTLRVLLLSMTIAFCSYGQKGTHTPYSSFGIGELKGNDYAAFMSMGGVSMAGADSTMINFQNPATYSFIGRFRPIFQVGMNGRFSTFETETDATNQRHFGLNQFALGVPIKKRWGAAVGLKPYAFTGYQISDYQLDGDDTTQLYTSEGTGGVNNFYFGFGYQPVKHSSTKKVLRRMKDSTGTYTDSLIVSRSHVLSIGANGNYLFGSSSKSNTFQYVSSALGLNSKVNNSLRFKGLVYDIALNYQFRFSSVTEKGELAKGNSIAIGASYSPRIGVRAFQDLLSYSYITIGGSFNGPELISDTIEYITNNEGQVFIPESYKLGIEYRIGPKSTTRNAQLRIGADARYQTWSTYDERFEDVAYTNNMKDRLSLALGLEWTPATQRIGRTPYINLMHYRLGFNYTMTELNVLNNLNNYTNLTSYGMSFGVGLPITITKNSNTNVNLGANFGRLGTTENGLIRENFIGLFFGLSITPGNGDFWFIKRKYD